MTKEESVSIILDITRNIHSNSVLDKFAELLLANHDKRNILTYIWIRWIMLNDESGHYSTLSNLDFLASIEKDLNLDIKKV